MSSSSSSSSSPSDILDVVIETILENLTSRHDRNAASLVSRHWHRSEARTRRHLFVPNCYSISPFAAAARFPNIESLLLKGKPHFADFSLVPRGWGARATPWIQAFRGLRSLWLKRMSVSNEDLAVIAISLPMFAELTMVCCDGFGTAGVAAVVENCRYLRVLDLIENDVEDEDKMDATDWISKFPQPTTCLESLVFESLTWPVDFKALEALVIRSPALRRLRVNHHVSIAGLHRLLVRAPHLSYLGTGSFQPVPIPGVADALDVADLEVAFSNAKSLVCLSGFHDLSAQYLPAIYPICGNLTSLNLSYADVMAEQLIPFIVQCVNLRTLWVLDTVCDEGLQAVAATCKDLRELRVFPLDATEDYEVHVSGTGLVAISEGCRKLQSILYFCQRMTNEAVVTMARNCPDLDVFRLCIMGRQRPDHDTGQPMDEGFGAIVMNCKKLTRLAVSGLLTDKAFEYIGKYGKLVRTLSVAFAGNSDLSLRYLLEGCPSLQKLEIRDCPFGDAGLLSGIHHYYNMRFLWMSSCRLTLAGCREVARRLPNLVVEVIGDRCENCDDEAVEKLYLYRSLAGPRDDKPDFVKIF